MGWIKVLTAADYRATPWKNGGGITQDVLLLPPGAGPEDFDIRLSLAPIVADGPFSAFPGIDRHITLLGEAPLSLELGGDWRALQPMVPFYFDGALKPRARLGGGPARAFNIMTRRGRWNAQVMPATGTVEPLLAAPDGGLVVLHAVSGTWQVGHALGAALVRQGETLVSSEEAPLHASCGPAGEAVVAFLSPTGRAEPVGPGWLS